MAKQNKNIRLYNTTRKAVLEQLAEPGWTQSRILGATTIKGATLSRLVTKQRVSRKVTLQHVLRQLQGLADFPVPVASKKTKAKKSAVDFGALNGALEDLAESRKMSDRAAAQLQAQIEKLSKAPDLQAEVESLRTVNAVFAKMNTELREMVQENGARVAELLNEVLALRGKR